MSSLRARVTFFRDAVSPLEGPDERVSSALVVRDASPRRLLSLNIRASRVSADSSSECVRCRSLCEVRYRRVDDWKGHTDEKWHSERVQSQTKTVPGLLHFPASFSQPFFKQEYALERETETPVSPPHSIISRFKKTKDTRALLERPTLSLSLSLSLGRDAVIAGPACCTPWKSAPPTPPAGARSLRPASSRRPAQGHQRIHPARRPNRHRPPTISKTILLPSRTVPGALRTQQRIHVRSL